ncbi:hypothetical protein GC169_03065 [bacterium]|nr:hypothetical protein [bacterium]
MTRFVIDPEVAVRIVEKRVAPAAGHTLLAPTLLRSEVLDLLYRRVRGGELSEEAGLRLNSDFARLKVRYLGDAVLRRRAWRIAAEADMPSPNLAEYLALTLLQADALIAGNAAILRHAKGVVQVKPFEALLT